MQIRVLIYSKVLKAEIGNKSFVATTDNGEDAIEIGLSHCRARRQTEVTVDQIFGHFSPHHSCGIFSLRAPCSMLCAIPNTLNVHRLQHTGPRLQQPSFHNL